MVPSMDVIRKVVGGDAEEGNCIEVGPSPDFPDGFVRLCTVDKDSIEWWGSLDVSFSKEFARLLGQALVEASK